MYNIVIYIWDNLLQWICKSKLLVSSPFLLVGIILILLGFIQSKISIQTKIWLQIILYFPNKAEIKWVKDSLKMLTSISPVFNWYICEKEKWIILKSFVTPEKTSRLIYASIYQIQQWIWQLHLCLLFLLVFARKDSRYVDICEILSKTNNLVTFSSLKKSGKIYFCQ